MATPSAGTSTDPDSGTGTTGSDTTGSTATSGTDNDTETGTGAEAHGPGGHTEAVSALSVAAKAIGISETALQTAVTGGKTIAQVAADHNVPVQTVIDALVADGQSELAAAVASGKMTQAEADAQKAAVTQRATDQVNGTFSGGRH